MYLSTRTQRGLSVSARTVTYDVWRISWPVTSDSVLSAAVWRGDPRRVAPRKGLSYFVKTAHRQQIKNGSDGLPTMKSIKSSTSTNAISRKNLESWSSYATHPSRQVCASAYGPDARQVFHYRLLPVRFIRYLRSPALVRLPLIQCQLPSSFSS
jgi:hypothetical protein